MSQKSRKKPRTMARSADWLEKARQLRLDLRRTQEQLLAKASKFSKPQLLDREWKENYEVLIDSIRGLVWEGKASQGSWQFTYVSKQAEHFLGYPRQRWLMDRDFWTRRLRPEDRDRTVAARKRALLKKEDHILEYRLINAERKTIWVQDSVTVKDQGGQLQLQGLLINITELKEAQAVLRQSYSELERLVEQRTASLARINAELKDEIVHRKRLEQELLELTEKGRRQQGIDSHGDVGQSLAGIALMLKSLGLNLEKTVPSAADQAGKIQSEIDKAMAQSNDPAQELAEIDLQKETLPNALKRLAARAQGVFHIKCNFKLKPPIPPINQDVLAQTYAIAQEAVVDAIKYAQARRVAIALSGKRGQFVLTVENNGHPFATPLHPSLALGLKLMHYRAKLIGAALQVKESKNHGPRVICVFPAKPLDANSKRE